MTSAVTKCPEDIIEKFNTWPTFKEPISASQLPLKKKKPHEMVHKLQVLRDMPIKTTKRAHLTPVLMAIINESSKNT